MIEPRRRVLQPHRMRRCPSPKSVITEAPVRKRTNGLISRGAGYLHPSKSTSDGLSGDSVAGMGGPSETHERGAKAGQGFLRHPHTALAGSFCGGGWSLLSPRISA
jgi:hypothetical protein